MNKQRTNAIITGYSLVLMALTAGFAVGYALPTFSDKNNLEMFQRLLTEGLGLYKQMLTAFIFIVILDIIVSWTLYQFFKNDNRKLSIISLILRLFYTFILGIAIYFLFANLKQGINNITMNGNYSTFDNIWSFGLVIFGGHLIAVGILMKQHEHIPKWLWILTIFAGFSYSILHIVKIVLPNSTAFMEILNNLLALPMALGEICLAIWLILKGGNQKINKTPIANKGLTKWVKGVKLSIYSSNPPLQSPKQINEN